MGFNISFEVTCSCGSKMVIAPGSSINGLECVADGYWKGMKNLPVKFRGCNQNWVCPSCWKHTETFTGFDVTYGNKL